MSRKFYQFTHYDNAGDWADQVPDFNSMPECEIAAKEYVEKHEGHAIIDFVTQKPVMRIDLKKTRTLKVSAL